MKKNPMLEAALAYAKDGWYVLPLHAFSNTGVCECGKHDCDNAGKCPAVRWRSTEPATTDPATITQWWTERPDRGIAIAAGEKSGITVLDPDGEEGVAELGALQAGQPMPTTPLSTSRTDHYHYYFAYRKGIPNRAKILDCEKLDARNDGGYAVAPPSRHVSGSVYKWLIEPSKTALAEWPEFLSGKKKPNTEKRERETFNPANPRDVARITSALAFINWNDEDQWHLAGWILGRAFKQSDAGFAIYRPLAASDRKFSAKKTHDHYYEASRKLPADGHMPTTAKIYRWARDAGWIDTSAIEIREGGLAQVVDDCSAALADVGVFSANRRLIHLCRSKEAGLPTESKIVRQADQLVISPVSVEWVQVRLGRERTFVKYLRDGDERIIDLPRGYAVTIVGQGEWAEIAELLGIVDSPTIRADGSLIQDAGYDVASGLYLNLEEAWPRVPDRPTKAQAVAAMKFVLGPFAEFDFVDEASRSVLAAAILGAPVRATVEAAPAIYVISPTAGAGKGLLLDAVATITSGQIAPKRILPIGDSEEIRKVITSAILAGDRSIVFDNIPRGHTVRSHAIDMAITSGVWQDRILGVSADVKLPFRMNVYFTGNNISCHTDAIRRSLFCHIDPKCENPEKRKFKITDLLEYLREHRRELMVAALTVLRAYAIAKDRVEVPPLGSFEKWSRRVREPLVWVGRKDPVTTQEGMRPLDDEAEDLGVLLPLLAKIPGKEGDTKFRAADVVTDMVASQNLRDAIYGLGLPVISAKSIGRYLRSIVGQVRNKRCLASEHDPVANAQVYWVEDIKHEN